jgi:sugar lactone lactonase YvrE
VIEQVEGVVDDGFAVLAVGFGLAEGPVADPDGAVWISDAIRGGVHRVVPGAVQTYVPERRGVGGLVRHASGALLAAGRDVAAVDEHGARAIVREPAAAGFNDLGAGPDGQLLAGVLRYRPFRGEPPVPGWVEIVDVDGRRRRFEGAVTWPNGVAVSVTGWVYVADFATGVVLRAPWSGAGNPELHPWWSSPSGQADGLAVDEAGGVVVALGAGGAFARVRPDGTTERIQAVPAGFVSSVCFAGDGRRELIVTTGGDPTRRDAGGGRVLRLPVDVPGLPVPLVRIPLEVAGPPDGQRTWELSVP